MARTEDLQAPALSARERNEASRELRGKILKEHEEARRERKTSPETKARAADRSAANILNSSELL